MKTYNTDNNNCNCNCCNCNNTHDDPYHNDIQFMGGCM